MEHRCRKTESVEPLKESHNCTCEDKLVYVSLARPADYSVVPSQKGKGGGGEHWKAGRPNTPELEELSRLLSCYGSWALLLLPRQHKNQERVQKPEQLSCYSHTISVFHTLNHSFELVFKFPLYLNPWEICGILWGKEVSKLNDSKLSFVPELTSFHPTIHTDTWTLRQLQTTAINVHVWCHMCMWAQSATMHKCRSEDNFKKSFLSYQHVSRMDSNWVLEVSNLTSWATS